MMTECEWAPPRWEPRSVNDRGCSIMAAPGGGDEVGHFLPLRPENWERRVRIDAGTPTT